MQRVELGEVFERPAELKHPSCMKKSQLPPSAYCVSLDLNLEVQPLCDIRRLRTASLDHLFAVFGLVGLFQSIVVLVEELVFHGVRSRSHT